MTFLAVSVSGSSVERICERIRSALGDGADMVELRIDLMPALDADDLRSIRDAIPGGIPVIVTLRSADEGGQWRGPESDRTRRLEEFGSTTDYIDVELTAWRGSDHDRQGAPAAVAVDDDDDVARAGRRGLILSRHDPRTRPPTLQADFVAMAGEPACDVPKLAWRARSIRDNFEAFELMRESPRPAIVICMGEPGLLSRVLAGKFGAFATFAAPAAGAETAPGQVDVGLLKRRYRWDSIDRNTRVFGVIGDPVGHSIGPAVHNAAFEAAGVNAVYLPLPVTAGYESFKAFMVEWLARPWLDLRGASVTAPHKENALRFASEHGGRIDDLARRIGAVNTLVIEEDGGLSAYNTDYHAALDCICRGLDRRADQLGGLTVAVLGAGGAARAVVAAMADAGANVSVFNRSPDKAERLARQFGCRWRAWPERIEMRADVVVNCTSLGMWPNRSATPMPREALRRHAIVFDTVYNPLETRLLRDSGDCGCRRIDGLAMFARQAEAQFRFWTGQEAPAGLIRTAGRIALEASAG